VVGLAAAVAKEGMGEWVATMAVKVNTAVTMVVPAAAALKAAATAATAAVAATAAAATAAAMEGSEEVVTEVVTEAVVEVKKEAEGANAAVAVAPAGPKTQLIPETKELQTRSSFAVHPQSLI